MQMWSSSTGEIIKVFDGLKGRPIDSCDIDENGKQLVIFIEKRLEVWN